MSEGHKAAEEVKGGFKAIGDLGEGIRKNINSFADDVVGGNKTHQSTGVSKDASEVKKGLENAGSTGNSTTGTTYTSDTSGTH